jgi:hypothetical protein
MVDEKALIILLTVIVISFTVLCIYLGDVLIFLQ